MHWTVTPVRRSDKAAPLKVTFVQAPSCTIPAGRCHRQLQNVNVFHLKKKKKNLGDVSEPNYGSILQSPEAGIFKNIFPEKSPKTARDRNIIYWTKNLRFGLMRNIFSYSDMSSLTVLEYSEKFDRQRKMKWPIPVHFPGCGLPSFGRDVRELVS